MEQLLIRNMLFATSLMMYAYGLFSFLTLFPKGKEYYSYIVARKIFGSYMILIASCLIAHWYFDLRQHYPFLATSLSLFYFTPGSIIMSVIFSLLIKGDYPFRKRLKEAGQYALYTGIILTINYLFVPEKAQHFALIATAILFIITAIVLIVRFYRLYHQTLRRADNFYSDNISKRLKWIPVTVYIIILLVLIFTVLSIVTNISYIPLFLLMGISVYTAIFISLQNHMVNIAKMKELLITSEQSESAPDDSEQPKSETIESESRESRAVKMKLDEWIENRGFTKQGLTLDDLAQELGTNRTYISSYINSFYNLTFRGWIASMRIEYSKELLLQNEELSASMIAIKVGYSPNAFIKIFTKTEGMPPLQWRSDNR